jgi:hypothetical protein
MKIKIFTGSNEPVNLKLILGIRFENTARIKNVFLVFNEEC